MKKKETKETVKNTSRNRRRSSPIVYAKKAQTKIFAYHIKRTFPRLSWLSPTKEDISLNKNKWT
jgi:hypothetical protein